MITAEQANRRVHAIGSEWEGQQSKDQIARVLGLDGEELSCGAMDAALAAMRETQIHCDPAPENLIPFACLLYLQGFFAGTVKERER